MTSNQIETFPPYTENDTNQIHSNNFSEKFSSFVEGKFLRGHILCQMLHHEKNLFKGRMISLENERRS